MPSGKSIEVCGAKKATAPGQTCHLSKGWGTPHPGMGRCKWHGGNTQTGRMAAAKEGGMRILKYTDPIELDPTTALLQELYRTAGHVQYLDQQIGEYELKTDEEIPDHQRQWMTVHMVERQHMAKVAKLALDAGIAEREIQLAEQQGMILASAIEAILEALELTPSQSALIPSVVPRVLRNISVSHPVVIEGG